MIAVALGLFDLWRDPRGLLAIAQRWGLREPTAGFCLKGLAHPLFFVGGEPRARQPSRLWACAHLLRY